MDIVTLMSQLDKVFVMVVLLLVINIGWSLLLIKIVDRLKTLEDIAGIEKKEKRAKVSS